MVIRPRILIRKGRRRMSNTEKHNNSNTKSVWKAILKNTDDVLTVVIVQVLVRAVVLLPIVLSARTDGRAGWGL